MKKTVVTLLVFCLLTLSQISFGQADFNQPIEITYVKSVEDEFTFIATKSFHNDKTKEMQLTGNVDFQSKKFEFTGAEKVIYNETTKTMTVFSCQGFTIDGKVIVKTGEKLSNILEYTVGDDKVYLF